MIDARHPRPGAVADGRAASVLCLAALAAMSMSSATADPLKKIDREKFAALFPEIDKVAETQINSGTVPALSIAIVLDDELVYIKGFGLS